MCPKEQKVNDGPAAELRHRVFVYGTLKRGQPNHHLMNMHELGRCRLIGGARTDVSFPLVITTRWNLPFLLYAPGHGQRIEGEMYDVDDQMLAFMDQFEGHPEVYSRDKIQAHSLGPPETSSATDSDGFDCWTYFLKGFPQALLCKETTGVYDAYSSKPYQPDKGLQGPSDIHEELRLESSASMIDDCKTKT